MTVTVSVATRRRPWWPEFFPFGTKFIRTNFDCADIEDALDTAKCLMDAVDGHALIVAKA